MRRRGAGVLAAGLIALAAGGRVTPQDRTPDGIQTHYRAQRSFNFPVELARIDEAFQGRPKPTAVQLSYSLNRGPWVTGPKHALAGLPTLDDGKRGFRFTAKDDGAYEFAVQYVFADGSVIPTPPTPQQRVVIDTRAPGVRMTVAGKTVSWAAEDENLALQVDLQCKWARDEKGKELPLSAGEWFNVTDKDHGEFRPADRYTWTNLPPGGELYVRVVARDLATNEGFSTVVRVPGNGTFGTGFPRPPADGGGAGGVGGPAAVPPAYQPRYSYVADTNITIDYAVQKAGRSGVQWAYLWVLPHNGTKWERGEKFAVPAAEGAGKPPTVSLKYKADGNGVYGFYVVAESGAGVRDDEPGPTTQPMMYVVVDQDAPYVRITSVTPRKGGNGPVLDVTWEVADPYLVPDSIKLEFAPAASPKSWQKLAHGLKNDAGGRTGRFTWEVTDPSLWRFYVRAQATDQSGNRGEHVWGTKFEPGADGKPVAKGDPELVIVDLEKPSGTITNVKGANTPPAPPPGGGMPDPSQPPM